MPGVTVGGHFLAGIAGAVTVLLLSGCDDYPRDVAGTMEGIRVSHVLHGGIIADAAAEAEERALAEQIAEAAGAEAEIDAGSAERLLQKLERGELDLVIGRFAKKTPWKGRVAFTVSPEAKSPPSDEPVLRAAVRSGENRWLIFVSKTIRQERRDAAGAG